MKIPIEVSARHIHLTQKDFEKLFGKENPISPIKKLSQEGEFAAEEKVSLIGKDKRIDDVRVLGPFRKNSQVEIALTDAYHLKLNPLPKIKVSGDLANTTKILVHGPKGIIKAPCIIAQRHLHCSEEEAKKLKIKNNQIIKVKNTSTYKIEKRWKNGDQILIELPMKIRAERRYNNSLTLLRGPVYYSLRIEKEYKSIKINYDNFSYKGSVDWEIIPKSAWNYGLLIDSTNILRGLEVKENPVSKYPFSDRGDLIWSSDSGKYITWTKDAPVIITARGMKIPQWVMKNNSADIPPLSPVKPEGDLEVITLIPYGCARLRITEFPVMDIVLMEDIMRPSK